MRQVYFRITDKCNLKCRHCCYSCGPDGKSISPENLEKVIDNIPEDTIYLTISGGEVFAVKDVLMHALDYITEKNKERNKEGITPISIQVITNGFWVKETEQTFKIIHELYNKGVRTLAIGSNDRYHREQGINLKMLDPYGNESPLAIALKMLKEKLEYKGGMKVEMPFEIKRAFAASFGRAKKLPAKERDDNQHCIATYMFPEQIAINPDGSVYPCCWAATPSIGSALNDNLEKIANRTMKDKIFRRLVTEGPRGVAKQIGYYKEKDEMLYRAKQCVMCMELFEEIKNGRI
ncbi:MAG: radical SAM protein [Candidatus Nanoarchaeia archaeon]|jgi:MoaA/NifB/PqqE/SkfB family radical SAM enzyme